MSAQRKDRAALREIQFCYAISLFSVALSLWACVVSALPWLRSLVGL